MTHRPTTPAHRDADEDRRLLLVRLEQAQRRDPLALGRPDRPAGRGRLASALAGRPRRRR